MFEIFLKKPEKRIQKYLSKAFVGDDEILEFLPDSGEGTIRVLKTAHPDGVTYLGSIGGFARQMRSSFFVERKLRVELISAVSTGYEDLMSSLLVSLVKRMDDPKCEYKPQTIISNVISLGGSEMKHIYLCDPFLWANGLPSISIDGLTVAFLYVLPISEAEARYLSEFGPNEFENALEAKNVAYYDLGRISSV